MQLAFTHGQIVTPDTILTDHSLLIENGMIKAITDQPLPCGIPTIDLHHQILLAGFIDIQVNGGGGCLFNDHPNVNSISKIAAAHRAFGTTSLLPTLVSEETTVIKKPFMPLKTLFRLVLRALSAFISKGLLLQ